MVIAFLELSGCQNVTGDFQAGRQALQAGDRLERRGKCNARAGGDGGQAVRRRLNRYDRWCSGGGELNFVCTVRLDRFDWNGDDLVVRGGHQGHLVDEGKRESMVRIFFGSNCLKTDFSLSLNEFSKE